MATFSRLAKRQLSWFELSIAVILISILVAVFLDRANKVFARAEQAVVTLRISELNTVISVKFFEYMMRGELDEIRSLEGSNPIGLLMTAPEDYAGVVNDMAHEVTTPGTWYFDDHLKALVYNVRYPEYFRSSVQGQKRIRYAVRLRFTDVNETGEFDHRVDILQGISIRSLESFQWLDPNTAE